MSAIVVIGTSAGGLHALGEVLTSLPPDLAAPVLIVQHRAPDSIYLAGLLQDRSRLKVCEAEDKMPLENGRIYLAPPDYHMLVSETDVVLTLDEPVRFSRPSIDVLFESAVEAHGRHVIAVVLTGANADGCRGAKLIAQAGGRVIVQDPATAESPTMPQSVRKSVPTARVVPLERIADAITTAVSRLAGEATAGGAA